MTFRTHFKTVGTKLDQQGMIYTLVTYALNGSPSSAIIGGKLDETECKKVLQYRDNMMEKFQ